MPKTRPDDGEIQAISQPNPLGAETFASPTLQLIQRLLSPYVQHQGICAGTVEPQNCTCGLTPAIERLRSREMELQRYGVTDYS